MSSILCQGGTKKNPESRIEGRITSSEDEDEGDQEINLKPKPHKPQVRFCSLNCGLGGFEKKEKEKGTTGRKKKEKKGGEPNRDSEKK